MTHDSTAEIAEKARAWCQQMEEQEPHQFTPSLDLFRVAPQELIAHLVGRLAEEAQGAL